MAPDAPATRDHHQAAESSSGQHVVCEGARTTPAVRLCCLLSCVPGCCPLPNCTAALPRSPYRSLARVCFGMAPGPFGPWPALAGSWRTTLAAGRFALAERHDCPSRASEEASSSSLPADHSTRPIPRSAVISTFLFRRHVVRQSFSSSSWTPSLPSTRGPGSCSSGCA